ncbi:MAG: hypothetical protein R3C19_13230 [Planctomycetaceae bacterium]
MGHREIVREILAVCAVVGLSVALSSAFGRAVNVTLSGTPLADAFPNQPEWLSELHEDSAFTDEDIQRYAERIRPVKLRDRAAVASDTAPGVQTPGRHSATDSLSIAWTRDSRP